MTQPTQVQVDGDARKKMLLDAVEDIWEAYVVAEFTPIDSVYQAVAAILDKSPDEVERWFMQYSRAIAEASRRGRDEPA